MKNSNRYLALGMSVLMVAGMANAAVAFAGDSTEASTEAASEQLKGDPDISADIVVGGWPSGDDAFKAALPGFNKLYPNINVEFQFRIQHPIIRIWQLLWQRVPERRM